MSGPRVVAIYTAVAAGEPMTSRSAVEILPGLGILGDRYATGQGHWSDPRWPDQELTLIEAELIESLGLPLDSMRRNVVTRGIGLALTLGGELEIGGTRLRAVRVCEPCRYVERFTRPGLFTELEGRGGIRAAALAGGIIRTGDAIRAIAAAPA